MARALRRRARPAKGLALAATAAMLASCVLVASSIAPVALAARDLTDSAACESCLVAAHVLYDAIGDPYVETKMAQFLIDSICPNFDDKQSCEENVNNLVGALVEWMRVNLEPDALCASAGVCAGGGSATVSPLPLLPPLPPQLSALLFPYSTNTNTINGPKDISCPLCMFVLTKIKDALSDPITRQKVHDAGIKACAALPEGSGVRDACVDFVERNEAEIYDYVDKSEPAQLCEQLAACPAPSSPSSSSLLGAAHLAAELVRGVLAGGADAGAPLAAFPSSSSTFSSPALARLSPPLRALSDGNCDACMAVVKDLHSAVASPQVQDQATAAAKTACAALEKAGTADLAERCRAGVDQYAPLVFGMALAYLQPASLCAQIGLCPAPSSAMVASPSPSLLVFSDGSGSLAGQIAAVAEEVVREVEAAVMQAEAVLGGVVTMGQVEEQREQPQQQPVEEDARVAVS